MKAEAAAYEGWFDSESLNVRLGFTRAAHQAASEKWLQTDVMDEEVRTYVHELTHYLQSTTTAYGLFLHYCREVQTADTVAIVRSLLGAGLPVNRPLLHTAPLDIDAPIGANIRGTLTRWLNIELLAAQLAQDSNVYFHYLEKFSGGRLEILPTQLALYRLQGAIAHFISNENAGRNAHNMPPWDNGQFDPDAINAEGDDDAYWLDDRAHGLDRMTLVLDAMGNIWGAESILESAATAAEWAECSASLADLRAYAADITDPELAMYKHCLARGLDAIPADDLKQFAFSFIALCELALSAPILPQHAKLRLGRRDSSELLPALRFQMLLGAAQHVAPLNGLADVARYNMELCRYLGWIQPISLIQIALTGPQIVADRRAQRYIWAQGERAKMQHAFTNVIRRSLDQSILGEQFRSRYAFPAIEYNDKTLYMGDKDALWWLTTQHILTKAMRQIMLGKTLTVTCPYRGAAQEAEVLTADLQTTLTSLFDRDFPMARVVMPN